MWRILYSKKNEEVAVNMCRNARKIPGHLTCRRQLLRGTLAGVVCSSVAPAYPALHCLRTAGFALSFGPSPPFASRSLRFSELAMAKKVLAYGDTVITDLELQFLEPGQWLNDNIIHFYFEFVPVRSQMLLR